MENTKRVFKLIAILLVVMLPACSNGQAVATTTESQPATDTPTAVPTISLPSATTVPTISLPSATTEPTVILPSATAVQTATTSPFNFSITLKPVPSAGNYGFTEGPAADANGNVYFTAPYAGKIFKWTPDGSVTLFLEGLRMPIGMEFDKIGNLIVCEGGAGRVVSIDPQGNITVLADQYNGVSFNEPNDLWIDAQGGIYFTDPAYQHKRVQGGEYVYYVSPDHSQVTRVISEERMNPNGIVGTADGTTLYVANYSGNEILAYTIQPDGTLSDKRLFLSITSDGMMLDAAGNLYITSPQGVQVFDAAGSRLKMIPMPEIATNVTFAGKGGKTLFITASESKVYTLDMSSVYGP